MHICAAMGMHTAAGTWSEERGQHVMCEELTMPECSEAECGSVFAFHIGSDADGERRAAWTDLNVSKTAPT